MIISDDDEETTAASTKRNPELEHEEPDTIGSTEQWKRVIQNWIGMIGEENYPNMEDTLNFTAVDRTIHPADDPLAKWNLRDIFSNRLESPYFVNALINLDSN